MTDVSKSSKLAREQLLNLISESMEAGMRGFEALLQLQSTMESIQQLRAGLWPGGHADMRDDSFPDRMITAESLHSF